MDLIKKMYNLLVDKKISLPTPIMHGVRTPTRQFSSCVKIDVGDSMDSILGSASAIASYVSKRAGIGINGGRIRGEGSSIRNGEAIHTGCIPFYKHLYTAVSCCSQGGVRKGSATLFYPYWHSEFENLVVLKNNKGTEEARIRHMDYSVQVNEFFMKRLLEGGDIALFSPNEVQDLYEAFFSDQKLFEELYLKYEQDETKVKKRLKAYDIAETFLIERTNTGRIYSFFADNVNTHSSFKSPIYMSNLCMEITLPTKPISDFHDEEGEIALCTLGAINVGEINSQEEMEEATYILVRSLDNILDYQDYPVRAAEVSNKARRSLGIGIVNYAFWLAKNGYKYSDSSGNNETHALFESLQYHLIKASVAIAKEKGACDLFGDTKYSEGILPIDTYAKTVDEICDADYKLDWESLRADIKKYGMRNSTLSSLMPSETSSQISNATNGIEPIMDYISVKVDKDGAFPLVCPDYENLKDSYELLWDIKGNTGYINKVAIMQKFVDQSISSNLNYDPFSNPEGKVKMSEIMRDFIYAWRMGLKTLYYSKVRDRANDSGGNGDIMNNEEICDTCVI